jgi:hypothetical protein
LPEAIRAAASRAVISPNPVKELSLKHCHKVIYSTSDISYQLNLPVHPVMNSLLGGFAMRVQIAAIAALGVFFQLALLQPRL